MHRAPLEQRRAKAAQGQGDATKTTNEKGSVASKPEKHVPNVSESGKPRESKKPAKPVTDLTDKENCSEKQRVARTVIIGGLLNDAMAADVHQCAKDSHCVFCNLSPSQGRAEKTWVPRHRNGKLLSEIFLSRQNQMRLKMCLHQQALFGMCLSLIILKQGYPRGLHLSNSHASTMQKISSTGKSLAKDP